MSALDVARVLLDEARPVMDKNLRGLTDEEYFWEPIADCWSVRRREEIRSPACWGHGDWVVEVSLDGAVEPAMTTIAWRLMHAYDCTFDFAARAFGKPGNDDWNNIDVASSASGAVEMMTGALDSLQHWLATESDDVLLGPLDPFFERPRSDMLAKALHESIHHLAEVGVLRAMWATSHG